MKAFRLTLSERFENNKVITILVEYYKSRDAASQKKAETLGGLKDLLGAGGYGKYEIEIQEIDVKE